MSEIALTYKIVIILVLLISVWGYFIYRRQSKELAHRASSLKRQRFEHKKDKIIEELSIKLGQPKQTKVENQPFEIATKFSNNGHNFSPNSEAEKDNAASHEFELHAHDPNLSVMQKAKQKIQSTKDQILSRRSRLTKLKKFQPNLEDSLHIQIAEYAKWVAEQSDQFILEQYENGVQVGNVQLLFDEKHIERLNGHWFDLFRPQNTNIIDYAINIENGGLYCPFTSNAIAQLTSPAISIINQVNTNPTAHSVRLIKECALQEFCDYLKELQTLTSSTEQLNRTYN